MQPQEQNPYGYGQGSNQGGYAATVADAAVEDRSTFIVRTYAHLAGAIFAFVAIIALLFATGIGDRMGAFLVSFGQIGWLMVLGAFMGVTMIANKWAHSNASKGMQYAGLGLYVVAEAIIFTPLILMVMMIGAETGTGGLDILAEAGLLTVALFGGLTAVVFLTRKNFSFLRSVVMFGGLAAMGIIIVSAIAGFSLGLFFMWAMVVFAAVTILYNTSNVLHEYNTNQYVAAALALFASFALLLWYVIQIVASRR